MSNYQIITPTTIQISWPVIARFMGTPGLPASLVNLDEIDQALGPYQARLVYRTAFFSTWVYHVKFEDARLATAFVLKYA